MPEHNIVELASAVQKRFESIHEGFVSPARELQKMAAALSDSPLARMTAQAQLALDALQQNMGQQIRASQQLVAFQESQRRFAEQLLRIQVPRIEIPRFEVPTGVLEALRQLPARTRRAVLTLARHGWYIDPEMPLPFIWDVVAMLADGDEDAERALAAYYERRLDEIARHLVTRFPARARILNEAFEAHRDERYSLSVLAFLVQADGVCRELTGIQLYRRRQRRPQIAVYVEQTRADGFRRAMLHALEEPIPIMAYADEMDEEDGLNRHEVLHGVSVDYDTRGNSLKALSLLWYVASVLDEKAALDEAS